MHECSTGLTNYCYYHYVTTTEFSVIADTISQGNYHELRNQVVVYFKNINKPYHDQHRENTILHMVCQEGYQAMAKFMFDPANRCVHSDVANCDDVMWCLAETSWLV